MGHICGLILCGSVASSSVSPWPVRIGVVANDRFYRLGRAAGRKLHKARWMWQSVAGNEADAIRAEQTVGRDMAAVVRGQAPGEPDARVQALLDDLLARLAGPVRNRAHRFEVTALVQDHPTAFALPGGFLFVSPSLVELCGHDRDETAFVVAHEMAHVIRRHAVNRVLREMALSAASLASPARGWLAPLIRRVGFQWLESAYSQEQEFEADALGLLLSRAAGFDPRGAIRLLDRLRALDPASDGAGLGTYFSTHPPLPDRIASLRSRLHP